MIGIVCEALNEEKWLKRDMCNVRSSVAELNFVKFENNFLNFSLSFKVWQKIDTLWKLLE